MEQFIDSNEFWRHQKEKNKIGAPKYEITTDADTPEEIWMSVWTEKWREQFSYFDNGGCGCCINLYEFDAPDEAIAEIPRELLHAIR